MMARLKVISGKTELGIENANITPRIVSPTTANTASMEFERLTGLIARLRDADLEPVR